MLLLQNWQAYQEQRRVQAELSAQVAELKATVAAQEVYLQRLRTDPALVERLLRQRLNYSRPSEWVFDFVE